MKRAFAISVGYILTCSIALAEQPATPASSANQPAGAAYLSALSSLLWPILIIAAILVFRNDLKDIANVAVMRMRAGGGFKIGPVELNAIRVISDAGRWTTEREDILSADDKGDGDKAKRDYYMQNRNVLLTHRLYRSNQPNQTFDIVTYIIPHFSEGAPADPLLAVKEVRYYLGRNWNNRVFIARNRFENFAILFSSYGATACKAEIHFVDGHVAVQWRYIDFEMAYLAMDPPGKDKA